MGADQTVVKPVVKPENRVLQKAEKNKQRSTGGLLRLRKIVVVTDLVHCTTRFPLKIKIIFLYFIFILPLF